FLPFIARLAAKVFPSIICSVTKKC
uniref:Ranatuerin-4 n=3 Tax=Aquarana catesbeiana TaxID=8400 RepID=RN2X4_AQUCT|nr:RecName: Full=Ranatuerin-4 [Aquarana catesbeiana]